MYCIYEHTNLRYETGSFHYMPGVNLSKRQNEYRWKELDNN